MADFLKFSTGNGLYVLIARSSIALVESSGRGTLITLNVYDSIGNKNKQIHVPESIDKVHERIYNP